MSEEAAPAHTPGVSGGYSPQNFTDAERRITLIGIMIVFLLSALDQTIVSTAMPRIAAQLQGLSLYAWVTTAYLLSSTVMVPIYGKLSDLYGRKAVMLSGVAIFTLGSMLCGMAGEFGDMPILGGGMVQLIVFRAVQGLGGGALFISAFSIIADMFSPRERGKFAGIFGSVFGLASIIGPVVGGFFTQLGTLHFGAVALQGWRWIFYINLPWSLLSLFMIAVKMPALTHRIPGKIDWIGAALIVITFVPLLLALSWAGKDYAWGSPRIVGLLSITVVGLIAFIAVEAKVSHPILSLRLFRNRTFSLANGSSFVVFIAAALHAARPRGLAHRLGHRPAAADDRADRLLHRQRPLGEQDRALQASDGHRPLDHVDRRAAVGYRAAGGEPLGYRLARADPWDRPRPLAKPLQSGGAERGAAAGDRGGHLHLAVLPPDRLHHRGCGVRHAAD
jgi:MFS family permease